MTALPVSDRTLTRNGIDFPNAHVGEIITYFFDFSDDLASDETIATSTWQASVAADSEVADPSAASIVSGAASITGNVSGQRFAGFVGGVKYLVEATIVTNQTNTLNFWSHIYCEVAS